MRVRAEKLFYGQGVPKDYIQAQMWAIIAATLTPPEVQAGLAQLRDSIPLAGKMRPDQVVEAQKRASEWVANFQKR